MCKINVFYKVMRKICVMMIMGIFQHQKDVINLAKTLTNLCLIVPYKNPINWVLIMPILLTNFQQDQNQKMYQ